MRRRVLTSVLCLCISSILTSSSLAATLESVIPGQAPRGARVVVTGAGLDDPQLVASFAAAGGGTAAASIISRTATEIELRVPETAMSGLIHVGSATLPFTVTSDPGFVKVATLFASDGSHDLVKQLAGTAVDRRTGLIFVADTMHHRIVSLTPAGVLTVAAGAGKPGYVDGAAATAQFNEPNAVAWDSDRNILYIADSGNHAIRQVTPDGNVSTFAGSGRPGLVDGSGAQASFARPSSIALDANGNVVVADSGNDAVRVVTPQGVVSTLTGGIHGGYADGPLAQALFNRPEGIAVSANGTLYIADTGNNRIRAIFGGIVTTVAGTAHPSLTDGNATTAEFKEPASIAVDSTGSLLVADRGNNAIRFVVFGAGGTTVVTIAAQTGWKMPSGIASEGAIMVGDSGNDALRAIYRALTASALYPRVGPPAGGNVIRLFGTGFVPGATKVMFGSQTAPVAYVTSTELLITVPAGGVGAVDVSVETPGGTVTLAGGYTYVAPPTISSVTPAKGSTSGGLTLAITGTNFINGETLVTIGGINAAVVVVSSSTLTVTTPPGIAGPADVVVSTSAGSDRFAGAFTYLASPTITSFLPISGRTGSALTIAGTNFDPDASGDLVTINGFAATVTSASATSLAVIVPAAATSGPIRITTAGGSVQSAAPFTVVNFTSLDVTPHSLALTPGDHQQLTATASLFGGGTITVTTQAEWRSSNSAVTTVDHGLVTAIAAGQATITAAYSGFTSTASVAVTTIPLPPDPATIAPPLNLTQITPFASAYAFLYSGPNAIQTGVAANTIDTYRAAVIRGTVHNRDGSPLPAVRVTIAGHPEFGQTLSRADGGFDLAVNGGAPLTVHYERAGYLAADRRVLTVWQDFAIADDVALITLDPSATTINAGTAAPQIARATTTTDERGSRTATILFPAGTSVSMTLPGGSSAPLSTLTVRVTEYTIGANGPMAMPASLPPSSMYTYCAEFSVDEAIAANATSVVFSKPVPVYVENFIGLPVGTAVPVGFYDRDKNQWQAINNGRVIKVLSITNGVAALDTNGDGVSDDATRLTALGIDSAEQQTLASLYPAGQTLWRVALVHFSPHDLNLPGGPPKNAKKAKKRPRRNFNFVADPSQCPGSIIDCHNQVLGEAFGLAGSSLGLRYSSANQQGRRDQYQLDIPVTDSDPAPDTMLGATLRVSIAGQQLTRYFSAAPDQHYLYEWDGRDVYGRVVEGARTAVVEIGYTFERAIYGTPAAATQAFALWSDTGVTTADSGEITLWSRFEVPLGTVDPKASLGLGGWSLTAHHVYDPIAHVLHLGNGVSRYADAIGNTLITAAGNGSCCTPVEGVQATATPLNFPGSVTPAADGSFYVTTANRILLVDRSGIIRTFAGNGQSGFSGDGGTATAAKIRGWYGAVGPDGSFYFVDDGRRIRRVTSGIITTIAGNGVFGNAIEGLATQSPLDAEGLAVGPDGSVYIASSRFVEKVTADGQLHIVAGAGTGGVSPAEGVVARRASFVNILSLAVGSDESLYIADANNGIVYRITPDGLVHPVAGNSNRTLTDRDGVPATSVAINGTVWGIDVGADGTIYFSTQGGERIRAVRPDGILVTVAGGGAETHALTPDGLSAVGAPLNFPADVKIAPDGSLLVAALNEDVIKRIVPSFPSAILGETVIASQSGGVAYVFDSSGRHLRTVDTNTGIILLRFGYESHGYLSSITDRDDKKLSIERSSDGTPTAIIAPGGQRTGLALDAQGYLSSVTDPGGEITRVVHSGGLLTQLITPRGFSHTFTYDAAGRLTVDQDPAGGSTTLLRSGNDEQFTITRTTAEGLVSHFDVDRSSTTGTIRTNTAPNGLSMRATIGNDQTINTTTADNMSVTGLLMASPRFGMQAPSMKTAKVKTPSGLILTIGQDHTVTLADSKNPLSLLARTDTTSINGKTFSRTFTVATRQSTTRSPLGRSITAVLNEQGRASSISIPGIVSKSFTYDADGHLTDSVQGSRTSHYNYDSANHLTSMRDALGRTAGFAYDPNGHVTRKTLFDGRQIAFNYDPDGNVTSITPPGRPAHLFTFTAVDRGESYTLPGGGSTLLHYNRDRRVTSMRRPDGTEITNGYDSAGRLTTVSTPAGLFAMAYSPTGGTMTSITAPSGITTSYVYDGMLPKTISWSGAVNGSIAVTYDNDFHVTSKKIGSAAPITYSYDGDGLLSSAGLETIFRDSANGRITGTKAGLITDTLGYDEFGQVSDYAALLNGSPMFAEHYTRDAAGRITAINETSGSSTLTRAYGYDDAGRLAMVTENGSTVASYTYDTNSNRLARVSTSSTQSGTYDDQDRVITYGGSTFSYTANGEIASKTSAAGMTSYRYDAFGNLVGVTMPNGAVIDYVLDGKNRRVEKKINGTVTQKFLYSDGFRPIAQLAPDDSVVYQFLYAEKASAPSLIVGTTGTYRVVTDHLGSPRGIIDIGTGASLQYLAYDEFGNVTADTNQGFQPYGFAGGLYDPDTHLVHFGAREYDPALGRFLSRDPIGFAGGQANVYDYASNDPVNFIDPSGLLFHNEFHVDAGEGTGAELLDQSADTLTDPNASGWDKFKALVDAVGGALWGPCTSDATLQTLVTGVFSLATAGAPAAVEISEATATPINVIGKLQDTAVAAEWTGHELVESAGWSIPSNDQWVLQGIEEGRTFYLASEPTAANLSSVEYGLSVFGREVSMLDNAGYVRVGDYLVPGK